MRYEECTERRLLSKIYDTLYDYGEAGIADIIDRCVTWAEPGSSTRVKVAMSMFLKMPTITRSEADIAITVYKAIEEWQNTGKYCFDM